LAESTLALTLNGVTVRLDGKEWDEVLSSNTAGNKGPLTVTFTSLGAADTSGWLSSYQHPQGSLTLALKSAASDPDVTVTGTFGN
jgi:hypothetical protein